MHKTESLSEEGAMLYTCAICVVVLVSYLVGSLPIGYWFGKRMKGGLFDIRDHGSCSIGFTNVLRVLGWQTAIPVLLLDIAKGYLPVFLGNALGGPLAGGLCLLWVMLGHAKSLYFRFSEGVFSGGKSVASLLGGILALQPFLAVLALLFFLLILAITRIVSVSSILACVGAFALTFALGLDIIWSVILGSASMLILFTHRRNIARLIEGVEPRLGQRSETDEIISAFAFHPLTIEDFAQTRLARWIPKLVNMGVLSERMVRRIIAMGPIFEAGEITGIETDNGQRGRVMTIVVPLLPDQIQDPLNKHLLNALLQSAAVQAQRRGASILNLGALLSSYAGGGTELQKWCNDRGLTITIDNGAAMTIAATLEVIRTENPIPLSKTVLGIVGAKGLIGHGVAKALATEAGKVIEIARSPQEKRAGEDPDLSELAGAQVVVFTTGADHPIVTENNAHFLEKANLVVDVAVPVDVADDAFANYPDVRLTRSGMMLLPGDPQSNIDFHFGTYQTEKGMVYLLPACLAQGFILAATGEFQHASRGAKIRTSSVAFFAKQYRKLGLGIVTSELSEPAVFGKLA